MKKNLKMTPEGTKDFLFAECSAMDHTAQALKRYLSKADLNG